LFFESAHENALPKAGDIQELARLSRDNNLTYNVHLPTDISPGSSNALQQKAAVETICRVMDLAAPLYPTTCTLHIPLYSTPDHGQGRDAWWGRLTAFFETIVRAGIDPRRISIETLDYPIEWLNEILATFDLRICMDIGHLLVNHTDITKFYGAHSPRIAIVHLHGVDGNRDHLPLSVLSENLMQSIVEVLSQFHGTVSLEVFQFQALNRSLNRLQETWGSR